jgi:hypothetical protein
LFIIIINLKRLVKKKKKKMLRVESFRRMMMIAVLISLSLCMGTAAQNSIFVSNEATSEPTSESTAAQPSCLQWILGFSGDSCTETCSSLNGICSINDFKSVNSLESFEKMVDSSYYMKTKVSPGTTSSLCNDGVSINTIYGAPASFTRVVWLMSGKLSLTSCGYLESATDIPVDYCEISNKVPPTDRFCPCIVTDTRFCTSETV